MLSPTSSKILLNVSSKMSAAPRQSWTPPPRTVSRNPRSSFTAPKRTTSLMPAPDSPTQLKWLHRRTGGSSSGGSNGTPRWIQAYPVSRWRRRVDSDGISIQLWEIEINSVAAVFERDGSVLTFPNAVVRKYMPSKGRLSVYNATELGLPPRGSYTAPTLSAPDLRAEQISLQSTSPYSRALGRSHTHRRTPKRPSSGLPMRSNTIGHSAAPVRQNSTPTDDDDFRATHMSDNDDDDDEFDEDVIRSTTVWLLPRGSASFLDVVRRSSESFVVVHEDFNAPEENTKPVNLSMLFAPAAPAMSHRVALARHAVAGVEPGAPSLHFQTLVASGSPMPSMSRTASIVSTPSTSSGPSTLVDDGEWENTARAVLGAGAGTGGESKRCYRVHLQEAAVVESGKNNKETSVTYKVNVYGSSLAEFIETLDPEGWEAVAL
ncbi:hypothetical protein BJ742DRAFT_375557 [Cladochytrium replicatum]|nr:hypothetical protein BJ742DRAFT_375557 [Cladochytrium replicatum]